MSVAITWTAASRRYVVCGPEHFAVGDAINPWMDPDRQPCRDRFIAEWNGLLRTLHALGAVVDVMPAPSGLADMVFVRDGAVVFNGRAVAGRFLHAVRQPEVDHVMAWLERLGCPASDLVLPPSAYLEGGDVAVFGRELFAGWGFRTNRAAHAALAGGLGVPVHSLRLVDPRFYHLDTCLCVLDDRHVLYAPEALDAAGRRLVREVVPEPLELRAGEALQFCANAIVLDRTVVMSSCPPRLARVLDEHGFDVCVAPVGEFYKSGGAVSCLTLPIDRQL
ncbi:MAG TPA: arginine deiminase-related protein [Candidatus Dormibacteraeota bacterium]|nr:arginine deiminase-related protein [Candidatus Dormibacteraeota bacterium]